jgi:hypothetical protein
MPPQTKIQPIALTTARYSYNDTEQGTHRGKDVLGRDFVGPYDDRQIDPVSGKFVPLKVQSTNAVLKGSGGTTWRRRLIKNVGPLSMRLANWAFTKIPDDNESSDAFRDLLPALDYMWKAVVLLVPMIFIVCAILPVLIY